ncbi:hypothetical protein MTO96_001048 [Rhipicephalus appendiculatus]
MPSRPVVLRNLRLGASQVPYPIVSCWAVKLDPRGLREFRSTDILTLRIWDAFKDLHLQFDSLFCTVIQWKQLEVLT